VWIPLVQRRVPATVQVQALSWQIWPSPWSWPLGQQSADWQHCWQIVLPAHRCGLAAGQAQVPSWQVRPPAQS